MFGSGWRSTNHVVPFQNSLLSAYLKGVRKGTLIDDSARPEENDIRRRFLSDEGAAFTLLFLFENGHGLLSSLLGGHSPPESLNQYESLFSAFFLFSAQRIWLKDDK